MSKFLYPIKNLEIMPWIKHWLLKKTGGGNLPKEYQQVDYIESSGTQYIDTGFKPKGDTSTILDCNYTPLESSATSIFGCQNYQAPAYINVYNFGNQTSSTYNYITKYNTLANNYTATAEFYTGRKLYKLLKNKAYVDDTLINEFNYADFTCTYNAFLFAQNYNGIVNGLATMKLYSCKIYDNDTLVRDFIPCYRKSDEEVGLYDTVTKTFFTNQGTGSFTYGSAILPEEYQRVEYIRSTGTQYIDTGIVPSENLSLKYKVRFTQAGLSLFGAYQDTESNYQYTHTTTSTDYFSVFQNTGNNYYTTSANTDHEYEIYNNKIIYDGTTYNLQNQSVHNYSYSIYLFARNKGNEAVNHGIRRLFNFKMYENNVLVRNFVPCYRKSDNKVGLYDVVNNIFYTNLGTGEFSKGDDI